MSDQTTERPRRRRAYRAEDMPAEMLTALDQVIADRKAASRSADERRLAAGLPVENGFIPASVARGARIRAIGKRKINDER